MKMTQPTCRDLIYVSRRNVTDSFFYSHGIEFREFMAGVPVKPTRLLLLNHLFDDARPHAYSRFEYVTERKINGLIEDDVYGYGDFCWVDFEHEEELDRLTKLQIAELLLFRHIAEPLNEIPMNRFAYYAHDDGWINKIYVSRIEDYEHMLAGVILSKLHELTGAEFEQMPQEIKKLLILAASEGLFIDLSKCSLTPQETRIPITALGHILDMDQVYSLRDEITDVKVWLTYSKKKWELIKGA